MDSLVTVGTPHLRPPSLLDSSLHSVYGGLNSFWALAYTKLPPAAAAAIPPVASLEDQGSNSTAATASSPAATAGDEAASSDAAAPDTASADAIAADAADSSSNSSTAEASADLASTTPSPPAQSTTEFQTQLKIRAAFRALGHSAVLSVATGGVGMPVFPIEWSHLPSSLARAVMGKTTAAQDGLLQMDATVSVVNRPAKSSAAAIETTAGAWGCAVVGQVSEGLQAATQAKTVESRATALCTALSADGERHLCATSTLRNKLWRVQHKAAEAARQEQEVLPTWAADTLATVFWDMAPALWVGVLALGLGAAQYEWLHQLRGLKASLPDVSYTLRPQTHLFAGWFKGQYHSMRMLYYSLSKKSRTRVSVALGVSGVVFGCGGAAVQGGYVAMLGLNSILEWAIEGLLLAPWKVRAESGMRPRLDILSLSFSLSLTLSLYLMYPFLLSCLYWIPSISSPCVPCSVHRSDVPSLVGRCWVWCWSWWQQLGSGHCCVWRAPSPPFS